MHMGIKARSLLQWHHLYGKVSLQKCDNWRHLPWDSFILFKSTYHLFQLCNSCFSNSNLTLIWQRSRGSCLLLEALILKKIFFLNYNRGMQKKTTKINNNKTLKYQKVVKCPILVYILGSYISYPCRKRGIKVRKGRKKINYLYIMNHMCHLLCSFHKI